MLFCNEFCEEVRAFRDNFLSAKAKYRFLGFAHSQLKRIKTHREWMRKPPAAPPTRKEFGLPETMGMTKAEIGAFEALEKRAMMEELSKEAIILYTKEKAYKNKQSEWNNYQTWLNQRNPVRAEMERKYGFDGKFAIHMIRTSRMCKELLETGKLNIKRIHDREELLSIRTGGWTYEQVVEEAERLEVRCEELYKTSTVLPRAPDINKIDAFVVDLTSRYLSKC